MTPKPEEDEIAKLSNQWALDNADETMATNSALNRGFKAGFKAGYASAPSSERFKKPTSDQIVKMALVVNEGKIERRKLTDMVVMCQLILDRLYENGDMLIPSSKEKK